LATAAAATPAAAEPELGLELEGVQELLMVGLCAKPNEENEADGSRGQKKRKMVSTACRKEASSGETR
jgi:hypothetical protein